MMHYRKGENVEQEITKADLPFDDCMPKDQKDFLWMQVKGGTKVNNVITYAKNALEKGEYRTLVWSGSGGGLVKTVSCAEIIKRSFPLFQVTRMGYTTTEEHWTPQMEGLEEIVARRQIPCLHILMSLEIIDIEGVQKPNTKSDFWHEHPSTSHQTRENNGQRRRQQQQQHSGRSNQKKKNRQQQDRQNPQQDKQNPQQQRPQKPQQQQQKPQQQQQKLQQQQQKPQQQQQQQQPSPNAPSSSLNQSTKPENPAQREKKSKKSAKSNNPEPMET